MAPDYPPSDSGYWSVTLARKIEAAGFLFRPSHVAIRVDRATLDAMRAADADAIASVVAAD